MIKLKKNLAAFTAVLLFAMVFLGVSLCQAGQVEEVNIGKGGQPLEVESYRVPGKTTVIEFYSPFCPPCLQLAPLLEQLSQKKKGLVIKKVNINRPEIKGIDWQSPLAKQYNLRSVPNFMIYNSKGKLTAQGKEGTTQVIDWLKEAGLLNR